MNTETSTAKQTECPACRTKGKRVAAITLRSVLKPGFASKLEANESLECAPTGECGTPTSDTGWRFCDSTECDVVYFSETTDEQYKLPDLKVDVGVKRTSGERPLTSRTARRT